MHQSHLLDHWSLDGWLDWLLLLLYVATPVISVVLNDLIHALVPPLKKHELGLLDLACDEKVEFLFSCELVLTQLVLLLQLLTLLHSLIVAAFDFLLDGLGGLIYDECLMLGLLLVRSILLHLSWVSEPANSHRSLFLVLCSLLLL